MYKTIVTEIGEQAYFESFPLLVLFNESAPEGLRDVCIIHKPTESIETQPLKVGGKIYFDDKEYTIQQVGEIANKNLMELGHVSMYFKIEDELLPGAILLTPNEVPQLSVDSIITIL